VSEVVGLLSDLVRIPSVSGGEEAVRDAVVAWLRAHGVEAQTRGRNVVAEVRGTGGGEPSRGLLLCSHYDTVPVGPGWTRKDPLDGAVEGGKVHGRGSNDAKASIAAMMVAAAKVDRARLAGRVVLALVCDEETGGQGLEAIHRDLPPFSAAVVGEPTGLDACPGQRGLLRAIVHETGRSSHASRPWEGVNAIEAAARDVLAVQAMRFPEEDELLGKASLVATMIAGGTRPNVVPGECTVTLDGRSTPRYGNDVMVALLTQAVEGRVEVKSRRFQPVVTPPDAEIVRVAREASPTGRVRGFGGVSDLFHVSHVPGVVLGPGTSAASHAPDEAVTVEQVEGAVTVYARIVSAYLGQDAKASSRA
jgi:acetylornithine deacetylase/succinyl-diaminopimelate desuccinylase-like protein